MTLWDKAYRILKYNPFPKQKLFHTSTASIRAIFGGNRSGKTTAGVIEFLMHMTGVYPDWYPESQRFPKGKLVRGRIATVDFQKFVGEIITPAIEEWIDATVGGFFVKQRKRNPFGIPVKYIFKNGNEFDIVTYEQKTDQFEGWRGDIAWFDEPPPRDKYIATLRGLVDNKGRCWLTLTPLHQPWIYDQLYTVTDENIYTVTMGISENPTLSQEYVKNIFSQAMDVSEREARLFGKFKHLSGLVFKDFDYEVHVCTPPKIENHWIRYFAIDPHPRTPTACLWIAVDEKDQLYVYDELWLEDMTLAEMAMAIKAQEGKLQPLVRYIDPAMDKTDIPAGGFNIRKELMKHGIFCTRANNTFDLGISKMRQALRPEYSNMLAKNIPRLQISRRCTHTIYEFQHYLWDDYTMRPEDHTEKQKAKKKNDHFLDCYDDQTEVLTRRGWLRFKALQAYDEVMTVNLDKDEYEFQHPTEFIEREHKGKMVKISSRRGIFLVTPNHRMVIYPHLKKGKVNKPKIRLAKDLKKMDCLKTMARWVGVRYEKIFGEDAIWFAQFLGWYVAEGCLEKPQFPGHGYGVVISQKPGMKSDMIIELCKNFRWKFNRSGTKIYASSKELWMFLKQFGNSCYTKQVPMFLKEASCDILEAFISGLILGDGWIQNGTRTIATTSDRLADDVQEIMLKLGRSPRITVRKAQPYNIRGRRGTNTVDQYWIRENSSDITLHNARGKSLISEFDYSGMVYCLSVKNKTLVVRRGGSVIVAGNCLRYIMNANPRFMRMEESEEELIYSGEYTKYPTRRTERSGSKSSYFDLVEGK